jgi:hypothetical protein
VLRTRSPVRPLSHLELDAALELCARDLPANVFAASRVIEASRTGAFGSILAHVEDGELTSLCWASANVVPVETATEDRAAYAERLRRWRSRCASVFGPREAVTDLWGQLEPTWGRPRAIRASQPLLATTTPPSALGVEFDPRVRPARLDEVDLVVPAAAHMFTAEIGYPPYSGSGRGYRSAVAALIRAGHTYVALEDGEVIFKTDIGSLALGCAQLQQRRVVGVGLGRVRLGDDDRGEEVGRDDLDAVVVGLVVGDRRLLALLEGRRPSRSSRRRACGCPC